MAQYQHTQMQGQPLSVMIAAGPYTLDTDLDYEPFDALMEVARNDRPDALILVSSAGSDLWASFRQADRILPSMKSSDPSSIRHIQRSRTATLTKCPQISSATRSRTV
jgi:hypothetical protein